MILRHPQRPQAARVRAPAARYRGSTRCRTALQSPEETGDTYAENALIKARAAAQATGQPAFADDSGIEAEALDWRPGVRTARFAGEHATDGENLAKLHREAPAGSRARYVCVIAHVTPEGEEHLFEGRCEGTLAAEPQRRGRLRLRPALRRRRDPRPHDGGAHATPRRTRSPTAVTPPASCSHGWHALNGAATTHDRSTPRAQPRRGGLDRLQHDR